MNLITLIVEDLEQARRYASDMVSHVADEMWYEMPNDELNPIAWQVGHMAVAQYGLCLKRVRGTKPEDAALIPETYFTAFGKGSVPFSSPDEYPTPAELTAVFDAVHQQVIRETLELKPAVLDEPSDPAHPMFQTKGGALRFSAKHEMLHVGQIGLLRRFFGGEVLR